jgi:hypothetical protein
LKYRSLCPFASNRFSVSLRHSVYSLGTSRFACCR